MPTNHESKSVFSSVFQDRLFVKLIIAAALLHFAVAAGLWLVASLWGNHPPFELLSQRLRVLDAITYHNQALMLLGYWEGIRSSLTVQGFSIIVALAYKIGPAHALSASFLFSMAYLAIGFLAYSIARELGGTTTRARCLSLLVCLWPSSFAWTALPLKEPLALLSVFIYLYCFLRILSFDLNKLIHAVVWILGIIFSIWMLVFLKFYLWYVFLPIVLLSVTSKFISSTIKGLWANYFGIIIGIFAVSIGLFISSGFNNTREYSFIAVQQANAIKTDNKSAIDSEQKMVKKSGSQTKESIPEKMLRRLNEVRNQFARDVGASLAPEARDGQGKVSIPAHYDSWHDLFATVYELAKASFRDLFLFPYPWAPWPRGAWRPANIIVSLQGLIWYFLLPGVFAGIIINLRRQTSATILVASWGLVVGLLLAITILNRGTLFRLREIALIPLLLLWSPWPYLKIWELVRRS